MIGQFHMKSINYIKLLFVACIFHVIPMHSLAFEILGEPYPDDHGQNNSSVMSTHLEQPYVTITNVIGTCRISTWQEDRSILANSSSYRSLYLSNSNLFDELLPAYLWIGQTNLEYHAELKLYSFPGCQRLYIIPKRTTFIVSDSVTAVPYFDRTNSVHLLLSDNSITNKQGFVHCFSFDGFRNRGIHGAYNTETTLESALISVLVEKTDERWVIALYMIMGLFIQDELVGLNCYTRSFVFREDRASSHRSSTHSATESFLLASPSFSPSPRGSAAHNSVSGPENGPASDGKKSSLTNN